MVDVVTTLDAKAGAQEIKIMSLSEQLRQAHADAERARLDHCKMFKEHH